MNFLRDNQKIFENENENARKVAVIQYCTCGPPQKQFSCVPRAEVGIILLRGSAGLTHHSFFKGTIEKF
jgi:hypothetical protein